MKLKKVRPLTPTLRHLKYYKHASLWLKKYIKTNVSSYKKKMVGTILDPLQFIIKVEVIKSFIVTLI